MTNGGPFLSHVCFADDLVLFGEASNTQLDVMMGVLNRFCEASGEKISLAKSKILVSSNIEHNRAMSLSTHCGIPLMDDFGKYLGAPMIDGRVNKATYGAIISKAQSRLLAWGNQFLSMAGRITLIQSVLSALPTYLMQTTLLPDYTVSELEKVIRRFLWGEDAVNREFHALAWDKISLPKEQGGLNVKDIRKANLAFLAKLGWKILTNKECLWIDIIRKKYLRRDDFLSVPSKSTDSFT